MADIDHAAILRQHADTRRRGHSVNPDVLRAAAGEIERLRAERDEARREWCEETRWAHGGVMSVELIASKRGWDCFKEKTDE